MAFGRPTRYLVLDPKRIADQSAGSASDAWDAGITHANAVYCKRMHNLWYERCHPMGWGGGGGGGLGSWRGWSGK